MKARPEMEAIDDHFFDRMISEVEDAAGPEGVELRSSFHVSPINHKDITGSGSIYLMRNLETLAVLHFGFGAHSGLFKLYRPVLQGMGDPDTLIVRGEGDYVDGERWTKNFAALAKAVHRICTKEKDDGAEETR